MKQKIKQIERKKVCLNNLMLSRIYEVASKLHKFQGEVVSIKEINKKLGRNFSINSLQIHEYLKKFQSKGFLKIVPGGVILNYEVKG